MDEARIEPRALRNQTQADELGFETTAELESLHEIIGQPRALDAIRFGIGIQQRGYNLFALGLAGIGKRSMLTRFFGEAAADQAAPPDWCYVHNFDEPHKPNALQLPAGEGSALSEDMETLIEDLRTALSSAFESEEYRAQVQEIEEEFSEEQGEAFEALNDRAKEKGLAMLRTPSGLVFAPVQDGEVISPEAMRDMPQEKREQLEQEAQTLQEDLKKILYQVPGWQREMRKRKAALDNEIASIAVQGLFEERRRRYERFEEVVAFLEAVEKDVIDNVHQIVGQEDGENAEDGARQMMRQASSTAALRRYKVNLLVDNRDCKGAPVVWEDNPAYLNLLGRVEHLAQMGALITDFNLIKPGSLHRANGGFIVLEARKVLQQPHSWEGLKRALRSGQIRIESPAQMYNMISTVSLEPEPIPLNVKVGLIGEPMEYYLLQDYDPDFGELFKVKVDFSEQMDRAEEQIRYAHLIAELITKESLKPFTATAVARVIDHSARQVGDAEKLSAQMRNIANVLREADYWATQAGRDVVTDEDVDKALESRLYRSDRLRERMQESILRDTTLIDTEGERVGQINGLSVLQLGDFAFGRPSRITARVYLGKGELVDIEREVELGGPLHSKGILILEAFLNGRYSLEHPLSLSASLVFEQSYGGVDGDSASSAELYALLSAIAEAPIRQSLAVTGSVNQLGEVQAIGGVNEKIEGFFDLCKARGLSGDQGVLIPKSNIKHLMLRDEVVRAAEEGNFHVFAIETIDQGIEILTGMPAGEADEMGNYPAGTINANVHSRLEKMWQRRLEARGNHDDS